MSRPDMPRRVALPGDLVVHEGVGNLRVLPGEEAILAQEEATTHVDQPVLLEVDRAPVDRGAHLAHDVGDGGAGVARFVVLNEPACSAKRQASRNSGMA